MEQYWIEAKEGTFDSKKQSSTSLSELCQKIEQNYIADQTSWYEYTQTISPTKGKGTGRNKVLYNDLSPKEQIQLLLKKLYKNMDNDEITGIITFEYNKNGNIHFHALIRHLHGYESRLRELQKKMHKEFGRNSLSQLRDLDKYGGYIFKEVAKTGIKPHIINEDILLKGRSKSNILYYFEY